MTPEYTLDIPEIFPWDDNFATGIAEIDEQHKRLVALVNELSRNIATESGEIAINKVLDELTDYTVYHFGSEEDIWTTYMPEDPLTDSHVATHQAFVEKIGKARGQLGSLENIEVIDDVLAFLTHWLAFHILDTDRNMAHIVCGIRDGMSLEQAKDRAREEMSGGTRTLVEAILKMYDSLSARTLELIREVAQRQRAEHKLLLSKNVIESSLESIFVTDAEGKIIDANPACCTDIGMPLAILAGQNIRMLKPSLFNTLDGLDTWTLATRDGHWSGEVLSDRPSGGSENVWLTLSTVRDEHGDIEHIAGVITSVSQLIERQRTLELEVNHDRLTGLPNRRLLDDRLKQSLAHHRRSKRLMAVCFIDLDGFKEVNDSLGHDAGDVLLCTVSQRMSQLLRSEDTVARLGGDEFVILIGDLVSDRDIAPVMAKLLECIEEPVLLGGNEARVSASIGITLYPGDNSNPEDLLKHADEAMYSAKQAGKSRYHVWQAS